MEDLDIGLLGNAISKVSENEKVFEAYKKYRLSKEKIYDLLSAEQKTEFEKLEEFEFEYNAIKDVEIFKEGLKLGKKMSRDK